MHKSPNTKIIIITGAGRGIGAATARLAAQQGYAVCINYRKNKQTAEALSAQIRQQGGRALTVAADIRLEDDVLRLFDTVDTQLGPLTALVNNAGVIAPLSRLQDMDASRLHRVIDTNIIGSLLCAREAARRMSSARGGAGGAIVNLSSGAAKHGSAGEYVDYAASKGAIDSLTVGLAKELAGEGIRVNAVRPGFIDTDMHQDSGADERLRQQLPCIPMQRIGSAEEVAQAILWLLSDQASYCNGSIIDVTGGR